MMKKLTIFVDMDDTIEQLLKAWVIEANQRYGYYGTDTPLVGDMRMGEAVHVLG